MVKKKSIDTGKLDRLVANANKSSGEREKSYREQSLKLYPWICGRCAREFTKETLQELTVHHRDHNHDNNPADGSNWELLCIYCHDNEHSRYLDATDDMGRDQAAGATHNPFADLKNILKEGKPRKDKS